MKKSKYYRRPDGLYEVIRVIDGKRQAFRGRTCKEVDAKLTAALDRQALGRPFPAVANEWEREHEKTVKESARRSYRTVLNRLIPAFPGPVGTIRPIDVQRYITEFESKGYSAQSVSLEISVLRMVFSHAVLMGDIDVSPAAEVKKSRNLPRKTRASLTADQEAAVNEAVNAPFGLFPFLLLYTGLRRGEALALTHEDIDLKHGVISINKKVSYVISNRPTLENYLKSKNGQRQVPILPPLLPHLKEGGKGPLFPGKDGGYMPENEFRRKWTEWRDYVGFGPEITPHCFRHSFATICYEADLDPRQAASIFGDTPEVLEKVYTHLREERRTTAAEKLAKHFAQK